MPKTGTQEARVQRYMEIYGKVSGKIALGDLKIAHLPKRINNLRTEYGKGYIKSEWVETSNKFGNTRFKRYWIAGYPKGVPRLLRRS